MDGDPRSLLGGRDELEQSSILADPRHRRILSILRTQSEPMSVEELCRRLAVAEDDGTSGTNRRSIRTDLRHRSLPSLEAGGWIDRRADGIYLQQRRIAETVAIPLPALTAPDDPMWDVVSAILARPYRRDLLSVVADADGALTIDALADDLQKREDSAVTARSDSDGVLRRALHHVDVPKLAATGVIEYEWEERTVEATHRLRPFLDRFDTG